MSKAIMNILKDILAVIILAAGPILAIWFGPPGMLQATAILLLICVAVVAVLVALFWAVARILERFGA